MAKKQTGMVHNPKPLPLDKKAKSKQPETQILPTFEKAISQHKQIAGY